MIKRAWDHLDNIRYAVNISVRQRLNGAVIPDVPHFDPETQKYFIERLPSSKSYLEFGSGGSTMLAARLGVRTVSIESDRHYASSVRRALGPSSTVDLVHVNIGWTRDWGHPVFVDPSPARVAKWRRYVDTALVKIRGDLPDFVLVDGRFRPACALHVAQQASDENAATDILFDDYTGRADYHAVEQWLGAPVLIGRSALFEIRPDRRIDIPADALTALFLDPA